jgi:hypothetical protein
MTDQANPASRPWRRFLRFSVRGMIVLVLVIAGWLGWLVRSARIQREAVAAIERFGGRVSYDWEWNNETSIPGRKPWAPIWLMDLIGVDRRILDRRKMTYVNRLCKAWTSKHALQVHRGPLRFAEGARSGKRIVRWMRSAMSCSRNSCHDQ